MKTVKLSKMELSELCQSIALLLHAGVSTADALTMLSEEEPRKELRELYSEMAEKLDGGMPLFQAFEESGCFPGYACTLLKVGDTSGRLEDALFALSRYYEGRDRLYKQVRTALVYPSVLLIIMLAVIVVLLVRVLPLFGEVYADLGGQLTGIAGGLLGVGQVLKAGMPYLCAVLGVFVVFLLLFVLSDPFHEKCLALWRRLRGDKGVSGMISTAQFAEALAMCLGSGLPMEEALSLSSALLSENGREDTRGKRCIKSLEEGSSLAAAMGEAGILPPSQCRLLALGFKSGTGETVMDDIAKRLSEDAETALAKRVGQIEPAMVLVTSVLLGVILLSVMLPLMDIMTAIG